MSTPYHMRENEGGSVSPDGDNEIELGTISTIPGINYASYIASGKGLASSARLTKEGRIVVSLNLKQQLPDLPPDYANDVKEFAVDHKGFTQAPALNVVIMIVGSRGDVQPFLALSKRLLAHGHRVRIATHEAFRKFVQDEGLEFFCIGGDPRELMSYMVKNPGLMPGFESLTNGDIGRKRKMLGEILEGCWRSCWQTSDVGTFAADAIISNPPAFAHIHCAEALGIPLQLSFTMPWSATTAFPHPLVNISQSNAERGLTNYLSYPLAELMTWQGLGDVINRFRQGSLGLEPLSFTSGPGITDRLRIPWTYCFSSEIVPKPQDWKNHIDVVGFYFLEQAEGYQPDNELKTFLEAGDPPIYIGFGSVVVEDSAAMTRTIFEAVARTGVRALVSAGWGGLGGTTVPPNIFILGTVPHDWLFTKVAAVCHHGGAGTTAIGLRLGKPTIVVPFFGDQPFWGMMIHRAGAGPEPILSKNLDADKLAAAIQFVMSDSARTAAEKMGEHIRAQDGVAGGVDSFHRHLPILNMRCDLEPSLVAVWWSNEYCLKMSALAAQTLTDARLLDFSKLELHRSKEYESHKVAADPVTGGAIEIFRTITHYYASIAQIFTNPVKGLVNTTTAIPRGVVEIIGAIHSGVHQAPKMMGSNVRAPGKVTGFTSGLMEGGKGVFYGYYDGITGLVREPYEGAKKEGFLGFIKGSARSYVNVTLRPAAGIIGALALPTRGVLKSIQNQIVVFEKQDNNQRETRKQDGIAQFKQSNKPQRQKIIDAFKDQLKTTGERRKRLEELALKVIQEEGGLEEAAATVDGPPPSVERAMPGPSAPTNTDSTPQHQRTPSQEHDDADYERELARAMEISRIEHEAYERGLAAGRRNRDQT